jgi:hypothetical protein
LKEAKYLMDQLNRRGSFHEVYYLKNSSESMKTEEIRRCEAFLERVLADPSSAQSQDPRLAVGDLLIALESNGIPTFYTLNQKESQFFCDALGQELIVRPIDPLKEDNVFQFRRESEPAS